MEKFAKFCPKCKSLNVGVKWQSFWFFGFPPSFICRHCGYTSISFPEMDLEDLKKKMLMQEKKKR